MISKSANEKSTWLKKHRPFLQTSLKTGAILGVMAALIIPVNVWPSTVSKFVVVIVCSIIVLVLTLISYYHPTPK